MDEIENFDNWNNLKKDIHTNKNRIHFRQGEIWFVSIGQNIGYEVYGKGENFLRPVIIFRKINKNTFMALPLTSKIKDDKSFMEFYDLTPLARGGYTHQDDEQRINDEIVSNNIENVNENS